MKQIQNKTFFLLSAGIVDIYSNLSQLVKEQQKVNLLPYERFDLFEKQLQKLHNMASSLNDVSKCDPSDCKWRTLHMDSDCIMTGDLGHVKLTSDESTALRHTRSVYNIAQKQSESTFVQKAHDQLKHLIEEVTKELDTVYRAEYKEVVINNRMLTD